MSKSIAEQVKDEVSRLSKAKGDSEFSKSMIAASELYNKLVEKGLAKRRGNNLMPIDKAHLNHPHYNCC